VQPAGYLRKKKKKRGKKEEENGKTREKGEKR
jgi:hypothetical protein